MNYQDMYNNINLLENPFAIHALSPDERGERLMIGRDDELEELILKLHKPGKITCLDGDFGVGKTSLVNVAAYKCFNAYLDGETTQLLIPAVTSFQLKKDGNIDQFCQEVFTGIAQTLLKYTEKISHVDLSRNINLPQINSWLNSPIVKHLNSDAKAGFSIGSSNLFQINSRIGASEVGQVNQSVGFATNGFETLIREWLAQIFENQSTGGIVCIIDNLELLETGPIARRMLEALRDKLFNIPGIRWVFCGANGVIQSLASSPRMTAFLSKPSHIKNIHPKHIPQLIKARFKEFSFDPNNELLLKQIEDDFPLTMDNLKNLYLLVNSNLRDFLSLADEFCEENFKNNKKLSVVEKKDRYEKWLNALTKGKYQPLKSRVSANAWAILDIAMSEHFSGTFGAGDHQTFNSNSKVSIEESTFLKLVRQLAKVGVLSKSFDSAESDEEEFNRDIYSVTANGALIFYARRQNNENQSLMNTIDWLKRSSS